MYKMPEKTDWAKVQNAHQETLEYGNEIYQIVKKLHPTYKEALEIGCAWGVSTLAILSAGKGYLTSVDSNLKNHAHEEVEMNGFRERWTFEHMDSHDFWKGNELTYDIAYIDGSHKYPQCYEDLLAGWDSLNENGILIADDYTHKKNLEVEADGTVEYGVSYSICKLMQERPITRIATTKHLWIAYK